MPSRFQSPVRRAARAVVLIACPLLAWAQQGDGTQVGFPVQVFKPAKVAATPERVAALKAPAGFRVSVFASGLGNARILAAAPNGDIYISRREEGDVLLLRDADGDGRADGAPRVVAQRAGAHGLAVHDGRLYLVTVKELFVADIQADGSLGPLQLLVGDLPDSGQHPNRTIAFGPDGLLYLSIGSTCNACNESNPENATIVRFNADFKGRTIVATGLRNTIGFGWQPKTGELWGLDHGIDFLGDEVQPEELNRIDAGKAYGWPHIWGDGRGNAMGGSPASGGVNPQSTPVGGIDKETWRRMSTGSVLGWTAHAAPMQMVFYSNGSFPREYDGDAFATMRGSWNRNPASGYEIVRVRFDAATGQARAIEPFVTGFLTDGGKTHIARPVGLVVAKDGALLMADDANGVVYRVAYDGAGKRTAGAPAKPPATVMNAARTQGNGQPMASQRLDVNGNTAGNTAGSTAGNAPLALVPLSFAPDGPIEPRQSAYFEDVSPALRWQPVAGARSYAVIVEDPDSKPVAPVVHWLAYAIPPSVTELPEGLQKQPRLTAPEGVLQGRNVHGATGWFGPRPPVGDPPHRYHVQVFALDTMPDLLPGVDREALVAAMKGHVIAKAVVVGTYRQTTAPLK